MYPSTGAICIKMQEKNYSGILNMRPYWKYSKATSHRYMKKNIGDLLVTKEKLGKSTKSVSSTKQKYLRTNYVPPRRDQKVF